MNKAGLCDLLQNTITELVSQLRDSVFYHDNAAVSELTAAHIYFQRMAKTHIMDHVVAQVLPHAHKIRSRDKAFFFNNRSLFAELPQDRVDYYATYFMHHAPKDVMDSTWSYFDVMLKLAEKYKKIE